MDTYEKKYKEIVGQIKKAYLYAQTDSTKAVLEEIFPELKESEDERIRGAIIDHLKDNNLTEWAAWLEKQGEKKSAWSEKDRDVINHLLAICNGAKKFIQFESCSREDIIKCQDWLTTLKEKI